MLINNEVIEHIYDENSVENEIIEALRDNRVEVFYSLFITLKRINSPRGGACQNKGHAREISYLGQFIAVARSGDSFKAWRARV